MWKLTVERDYQHPGENYTFTDRMYYEAETLDDITSIISDYAEYGIGSFRYIVEVVDKNTESEDVENAEEL